MEKTCVRCNLPKPITEFYKQKASKDGFQRYCKECANKFSKASEKRKPSKYRDIRRGVRERFLTEVRAYKAEQGCQHCEESDPICLELHHPDPSVKDIDPSNSTSRKMFYEEAEKCVVLCANCHRKEHHRLRQENGKWAKG